MTDCKRVSFVGVRNSFKGSSFSSLSSVVSSSPWELDVLFVSVNGHFLFRDLISIAYNFIIFIRTVLLKGCYI